MMHLAVALVAFKANPGEITAGHVLRAANKVLDSGFRPELVEAQEAIELVTDWLLRAKP